MAKKPTTAIRIGLWALPLYGALTAWATLDPQPRPVDGPGGMGALRQHRLLPGESSDR
jgi:hypothetical protein